MKFTKIYVFLGRVSKQSISSNEPKKIVQMSQKNNSNEQINSSNQQKNSSN